MAAISTPTACCSNTETKYWWSGGGVGQSRCRGAMFLPGQSSSDDVRHDDAPSDAPLDRRRLGKRTPALRDRVLQEENRVLRELHGRKRLRFTDDQRRRLAARGEVLGRRLIGEIGTLLTPDTILRRHRELIARKYDGTAARHPGRPSVAREIRELVVRMDLGQRGLGLHADRWKDVEGRA